MAKGRPGGNPNIANEPKTGPKTREGKLKSLVSTGNVKNKTKSSTLNYFRKCNRCPLRPRTETRIINGQDKQFTIASKCSFYKVDQTCVLPKEEFANSVNFFYKSGGEKMNAKSLQEAIIYRSLENAEIAKQTEMIKNRAPGHYTKEFTKLAIDANSHLIKAESVQKVETKNVNMNIDMTQAIIDAYKEDEKEIEVEVEEKQQQEE